MTDERILPAFLLCLFFASVSTGSTSASSERDDAGEKRVGAGDFIRVPGGHEHWSGGDVREGALFYQESSRKFDLVPAN